MNDDNEMLGLVDRALRATPIEPSADAVMALHRAIDRQRITPARRRRHRVLVGLGGAAMVLTGAGAAFAASGAVVPEPVRAVAHAVGLPIDSPDLAKARAARRALREGLQRGDAASVAAASKRLKSALSQLSPGELDTLQDAGPLLSQAGNRAPATTAQQSSEQHDSTTTPSEPTTTEATSSPATTNGSESEPTSEPPPTTTDSTEPTSNP